MYVKSRLCGNENFHDCCPWYDCFQICNVYAYNIEYASRVDVKNILSTEYKYQHVNPFCHVVTYIYHIE